MGNVVNLGANIDHSYYRMIRAREAGSVAENFMARRPSVAERMAAGKALREKTPRASHAQYERRADRPDPVAILEKQNETRVPKLVPVRYARMLVSPFTFLRGSAAVMADDLSGTPVTGMIVAACGDMHVSNFGVYASAERNLVFSINDFDEVHPGPWEWDLKRLAASAAVAARFMGGDKVKAQEAAQEIVRSYRKRMRRYAQMGYLQIWYDYIDERAVLDAISPRLRRGAERVLDKARQKGHVQALDKLTEQVDGEHRLIEDLPLIVRETHSDGGLPSDVAIDQMLRVYIDSLGEDRRVLLSRYRIVDVARKVVGVGSVGTSCWVMLLQGVDGEDPLFLQIKQAQESVLAPYVDIKLPFSEHGQRVVTGQRLTQGSPDIFLGWGQIDGRHFYVRQLADMKGSVKFGEHDEAGLESFNDYCSLCGWALALAHAKSGDPAMIAGYCGSSAALDEAIGKFAMAYLKQTEQDHETLDKARRSGRVKVASSALVK
ncbi:DUF2252 domain-containing protein [Vineibacter terrae]|uniref:DUF2252 domain-containing protein n=1 Tax=Vineibacter terrae TaxID=2586908 RepID=UPI002E2F02AE|nr:DUF2252 domain-containing protein [Vineibacter terrae]HEX2885635.1 DUF2252 domain-containing protein [Vineibacter terrae]